MITCPRVAALLYVLLTRPWKVFDFLLNTTFNEWCALYLNFKSLEISLINLWQIDHRSAVLPTSTARVREHRGRIL